MDIPVVGGYEFRCKVVGCTGYMTIDNFPTDVKLIGCPKCGVFNCRTCNAVHTGVTCRKYFERDGQNAPAAMPPEAILDSFQNINLNK